MLEVTPGDSTTLAAYVRNRVESTSTGWNSVIANERARLLREANAEPYGNEVEGRSDFVPSDIQDTIGWIMPDLIDVFIGGDKVVEFEPVGEEDEIAADQEGDVLNHEFINKCDGYHVLTTWFSDALGQFNGVIEVDWDIKRSVSIETYERLSMEEALLLKQDLESGGKQVTLLESEVGQETETQIQQDPETGQAVAVQVPTQVNYLKLRVVETRGCLSVQPVPPEEFFVAADWTKVTLDGAPLCGRKRMVTKSDLIEMGYDRVQVEAASGTGMVASSPERTARYGDQISPGLDYDVDQVEWCLALIKVDFDGDGIAEMRRVAMIGNEILRWADGREDNEEVDYNPWCAITPYIVAHRHHGDCPARQVSDLQRLKADLVRAMKDQLAMATFPPREISEAGLNEYTIEDMLQQGPDSIIRTKSPGQLREIPIQAASQFNLQAIEFVDSMREKRTGTSAYNQGMDSDSLNKTASGISQILTQSQKKIAMIARTFAETGVKDLFRKMHRLMKRYGDREIAVKLRNQWVATNPREWKDRTNLQVAVGLGSGTKPERAAMLQQILERQLQLLPLGLSTPTQIKHTTDKLVVLAGYKNPDLFFQDPSQLPQPEAGPSPEELLARAEQDKADVSREKLLADDDFRRDELDVDIAFRNAEMLGKYGLEVDVVTLQARINEQRYNQLRAEQDAQVSSQIRLEKAKKEFAADQQAQAANAA